MKEALLRVGLGLCAGVIALSLGSCGVGGALAIASGGGGGGGGSNTPAPRPPEVTLTTPSDDPASSYVSFLFVLRDSQVKRGDTNRDGGVDDPRIRIYPEFSFEFAETDADGKLVIRSSDWLPMTDSTIAGSEGTRALSLGDHRFSWNTLVDLPTYSGNVRARFRAEYEPTAGFNRKFRTREVRFRMDNRLAGTVFGGDVVKTTDVETFPVDVIVDGTSALIASAGAGIIERVDALGRVRRVVGIGVPGTTGDGGDPGVARLANIRAVDLDPATGLIYTNHESAIRVTNPSLTEVPIGAATIRGRTIITAFAGPNVSASGSVRVHPSGAILYLDSAARILAFNPQNPNDPNAVNIELAGVVIPPGTLGQIAGGGTASDDGLPATQTRMTDATSLAIGPDGEIYYGEQVLSRIRVINAGDVDLDLPLGTVAPGTVMTVAGSGAPGFTGDGGPAPSATLNNPTNLAVSVTRELFIADTSNFRIRMVNLGPVLTAIAGTSVSPGEIETIVGGGRGGVGSSALDIKLATPNGVAISSTRTILVADGFSVLMVNGATDTVTAFGKTALPAHSQQIYNASSRGGLPLVSPTACHSRSPNEVFFTDQSTVRVLNLTQTGAVYGGAAPGPGEVAEIGGGAVPGFAGDTQPARAAAFGEPTALITDGPVKLYVADTNNDRVRFINILDPVFEDPLNPIQAFGVGVRAGFVDTIVGGGEDVPGAGDGLEPREASLSRPSGLAVFGDLLFIADTGHHRVRCVNGSPTDTFVVAGTPVAPGKIATIYGNGVAGFSDNGPGPWFTDSPTALAIDSRGILYISEPANARIRALNLGLTAEAIAGVVRAGVSIPANEVATLVGSGVRGNFGDGGGGPGALIDSPSSLLVQSLSDGAPIALYFVDQPQHVVRILNLIDQPIVAAVGENGLPSITVPGGGIFAIAGGPNAIGVGNAPAFQGDGSQATDMRFSFPFGIAITNFDGRPAHLLVTDRGNSRLRRAGAPPIISPATTPAVTK